ncbi:GH32 C-terminal domain-containing protein [Oceanobacillus sojae]|uniref:GH32 C-terminal domain-containing protein n=1 Tax=Oceanobacillus sojae TaxID=582851 RepID=UPI0021A6273C|nr:GH32 C-terminal domain-containing protein [Oceanobacillus sojae]MCT1902373.1 GH32 C-terminal domain-containing protein [Oceanobacillus sojae]
MNKANTNLRNWGVAGTGELKDTVQGIQLTSKENEQAAAFSDTAADDFTYEADIKTADKKTRAGLIFLANTTENEGYMIQIDQEEGKLQLLDLQNPDKPLEEAEIDLEAGEIYHLKVKVVNQKLQVYWNNQYNEILGTEIENDASGVLGLHVEDGTGYFENVYVSDFAHNLGEITKTDGQWKPDIKGLKAAGKGKQIFDTQEDDFVLEGDISFAEEEGSAGFTFLTDQEAAVGYQVILVKQDDQAEMQLQLLDGTVLARSDQPYSSISGTRHHIELIMKNSQVTVYLDGYREPAMEYTDDQYQEGHIGLVNLYGTTYFENVYAVQTDKYFKENYRPNYHYTPARGSASDPNGLVYFEGEYHLFHQDGGTWSHAVSEDLIHWKHLPTALPWNEHGHVWSGSAVADENNTSGLFSDTGGKGLVAYYTSFNPDQENGNQRIGLAYSHDKGRTWEYSEEHPIVIDNPGKTEDDPGSWDFRDPKVVRDEENNRWIMVVSGGDHIRFFTSENLIDWEHTDSFGYEDYVRGGVWECPDLFELPIEGTDETKWVLMISTGANPNTEGSDAEYFIGDLTEEGTFINDNKAGDVLKTDFGKEFYASMSFTDMPDDRRITLAWMTNWDYPFDFPTEEWKGQLTIPRELRLIDTEQGIRLVQSPIEEVTPISETIFEASNQQVSEEDAEKLLEKVDGESYQIEAEIEIPADSDASEFGFRVRQGAEEKSVIGYRPADEQIFVDRSESGQTDFSNQFSTRHEADLSLDGQRVKLNIFVDNGSIEVFANDGRVVFSDVIFPDAASRGMSFYTENGPVEIISLKVNQLEDIWDRHNEDEAEIVMDTRKRETNIGDTLSLQAALKNGAGSGDLTWSVSDTDVVHIITSDNQQAELEAVGDGEAVITVSAPDEKVSKTLEIQVHDGEFHTNLTGWQSDIETVKWLKTKAGIRGSHSGDANYMAEDTGGNFIYEADMTLSPDGGAGAIVFRANEDGSSGYYFNLDPNMKAFRLFYKVNGQLEEHMVISNVPAFIEPGKTYAIKIEANGPHIRIDVDGENIIDLRDGTFAQGHFGLNVFDGKATYQNVEINQASDAELAQTAFMNVETGQSLYAANLQNGEPVVLEEEQMMWFLFPTGDEQGSYSIRTEHGQAFDLDTNQQKIQLYDYLGYDNQRWLIEQLDNEAVIIRSVHNEQVLTVTEDGQLTLTDLQEEKASSNQQWQVSAEVFLDIEKE